MFLRVEKRLPAAGTLHTFHMMVTRAMNNGRVLQDSAEKYKAHLKMLRVPAKS